MPWFVVHLRNRKYSPECDESPSTQFAHQENSKQTHDTHSESDDDNCSEKNVDVNESATVTPPPLYAIPDKLKSKKAFGSSDSKMQNDKNFCEQTEEPTGVQDFLNEVVCNACTVIMLTNLHSLITGTFLPCTQKIH